MTVNLRHVAGAVAAAVCLATGCATTTPPATAPTTVAPTTTVVGGATPAETAAATLRAQMTALLQAHVFLVGVASSVAATGGDPAPAVAAVDANGQDLAMLVASATDAASGGQFSTIWRTQTPAFIAYAKAKAAGDTAAASAAKSQLDAFGQTLAAFFAARNVYLLASGTNGLQTEFQGYLGGLETAIDDEASRSPSQYADLATAANTNMPHTADVLAAAFAKAHSQDFPGTVTQTASNLRSTLTAALVSRTFEQAFTSAAIVAGGDAAPPTAALTLNARSVSNVFSAAYSDDAARRVLDLLNARASALASYAKGAAAHDKAGQSAARADLTKNTDDLAGQLSSTCPKIDRSQLTASLTAEAQAALAIVDAQAAHDPGQFTALRAAAATMPPIATTISEAIAEQFPTKYIA